MYLCTDWPCVVDWAARAWGWLNSNYQPITAIAAVVIALASLAVSLWSALSTRLNARISALPLLHLWSQATPEGAVDTSGTRWVNGELVTKLRNGGLGPAYLTAYELMIDGVPLDLSDEDKLLSIMAKSFGLDEPTTAVTHFHLNGGIAIPKDGFVPCFTLNFRVPKMVDYGQVVKQLGRVRVRAEYQSMYGDQMRFDNANPILAPKLSYFRTLKRTALPPDPTAKS